MTNDVTIRNLEQLQEDDAKRTPRAVTIAFVVLGGACVAFAALALGAKRMKADPPRADPLGELVAQHGHAAGAAKAPDLTAKDVTFPNILSDGDKPTTALAAVRPAGAASAAAFAAQPTTPPPAADRLPVVPLPAQQVLEATPMVTRPRDALTRAAGAQAQMYRGEAGEPAGGALAPAGKEGGYQLQVSSFRTQAEADHFSEQLRARGHKAYVVEAHVNGRGTWFRVRVGPFTTQNQAATYRASFEAREHVVPFIVPPQEKK